MANYYLKGYEPPKNITSKEQVKNVQQRLGVKADGIWGPDTQAAWDAMRTGGNKSVNHTSNSNGSRTSANGYTPPQGIDSVEEIKQVQRRLGVTESGVWDRNTNDTWEAMRSGGSVSKSKFTATGFTPPEGVDSSTDVRNIQKVLGIRQSGIWDETTQSAWKKEFGDLWTAGKNENYQPPHGVNSPGEVKQIQSRLGVTADGIWGEETQTAWDRMRGANTAATFTQSVINRGKTYNDTSNIDTPELQHQQTPIISQEYLDQQIRRTSFLKKADVYLHKNLSKQRQEEDNIGVTAMTDLYKFFVSQGKSQDAKNILVHLKAYNQKALNAALQKSQPKYGESGYRYNANDARLQLARESGIGIYDEMPAFENGNVVVNVYDGVPLFGLNDEQKSNTQRGAETIMNTIVSAAAGKKKLAGAVLLAISASREFQWKEYFEAHPEAILQQGDVVIYYSPSGHGGYGSNYAFRNGDLLYEDHRFNRGETILGKNFMKYASEFKEDTFIESLYNILEGEAKSAMIQNTPKAIRKIIQMFTRLR